MHVELKKELKQFERELSVLVARFLRIYDEVAGEDQAPPAQGPTAVAADGPKGLVATGTGFTTDYLTAYA